MLSEKKLLEIAEKSKDLLETLPIAHYLKGKMEIVFDTSAQTSYFDPSGCNIHVALCNIVMACASIKEETDDGQIEKIVRGLLYHEVSHAILTPSNLFNWTSSFVTNDQANIIEDERIETVLKDYYYGVDFKENLSLISPYRPSKNLDSFVFNCLRHRRVDHGANAERIAKAIKAFLKETEKTFSTYNLAEQMGILMNVLKDEWDAHGNKAQNGEGEKAEKAEKPEKAERGGEGENDSDNGISQNDGEKGEADSSKEEGEKAEGKEQGENGESSREEGQAEQAEAEESAEGEDGESISVDFEPTNVEESFEEHANYLRSCAVSYGHDEALTIDNFTADESAKVAFLKAIVRATGVGIAKGHALNGYDGRFSSKRYMTDFNHEMKWFRKGNPHGEAEARKVEKKILNIWLDQSGSYLRNDFKTNGLLKALVEIEKTHDDFRFNLVKMTTCVEIVRDPSKRYSRALGCNELPVRQFAETYAELNPTGKEYNIVLFDGLATFSRSPMTDRSNGYRALLPFNNKRSAFITERSNFQGIATMCPNAREIIQENSDYTGKLAENVAKILELLF